MNDLRSTRTSRLRNPDYLHAPARILMAIIFLVSGTGKLATVEATKKYMESYGVPGYLIWPAAGFEISTGVALLAGWHTHDVSLMLGGWCLLVAGIFHRDFEDQNQQIHFMKNLAMAGGFLVLALHGAPHWSVEVRLSSADRDGDELPMYKE